ncbi:MAG: hypothetical protein IT208_15325 [Chthonomonadales bacterium]|nr:hypothetical protein [Chthonomonadales bacterium]
MRVDEAASAGWLWRTVGCAALVVLGLWLLMWLLLSIMGPLRATAQSMRCQGNLHRLARGLAMYADDYGDRYPAASRWMDGVAPYVEEDRTRCPSRPESGGYGYAMSTALAGRRKARVLEPEKAPLVYDSTRMGRSAADAFASLPKPGRHRARPARGKPARRGDWVAYADGSARFVATGAAARAAK